MNNIDYKVGIYIRLSREDEEKEKYQESESIGNQQKGKFSLIFCVRTVSRSMPFNVRTVMLEKVQSVLILLILRIKMFRKKLCAIRVIY